MNFKILQFIILSIFYVGCEMHNKKVIEIKPIEAKLIINVIEVDSNDDFDLDLNKIQSIIEPFSEFYSTNVYGVWLVLNFYHEKNIWPQNIDELKIWSKKYKDNNFCEKIKSINVSKKNDEILIDIINFKNQRNRTVIRKLKFN